MNHINLRDKLDAQITSYIDYQKTTTRSNSIKLSKEIARLSQTIELIDMMTGPVRRRQVECKIEYKKSKIYFQQIETTDMSNKKRNAPELGKPIHDEAKESRLRALQLASEHVDIRPIKYLLKR